MAGSSSTFPCYSSAQQSRQISFDANTLLSIFLVLQLKLNQVHLPTKEPADLGPSRLQWHSTNRRKMVIRKLEKLSKEKLLQDDFMSR